MLKDYIESKPKIESKRLVLRPLIREDIEDLRQWTPNREIYKYWGKNPGKVDLKPELLFEKPEKPSKSFHLWIEFKQDKKVIGDIYIYLIERDKKAKVAIRLSPEYHNRGIGTEAVKTMVNWCFENTELQIIWSDVDKENIASIKLLEKCDFKRTKEVSQGKMVSTICDYYIYEIVK
ncbi:MAG: GNAT family N-acetyltransferase [Clostridia bacterium]|nr:GNAT family N-acetyltransferase [Clostridia bacterium]